MTDAALPPLLITTSAAAADVPGCEMVLTGDSTVSLAKALTALSEHGLTSVLCEGGPSLLGQPIADGLLDELCLTYSPLLVGPGAGRIVSGDQWSDGHRMRLAELLADEGLLFCRYLLAR